VLVEDLRRGAPAAPPGQQLAFLFIGRALLDVELADDAQRL
jgi:hypothetical protein